MKTRDRAPDRMYQGSRSWAAGALSDLAIVFQHRQGSVGGDCMVGKVVGGGEVTVAVAPRTEVEEEAGGLADVVDGSQALKAIKNASTNSDANRRRSPRRVRVSLFHA